MAAADGSGWRLCCKVLAISPRAQKGEPAGGAGSGGEVLRRDDGDCQRRAWLDASLAGAALGQRTGPRLCPPLLPWDFRTESRTFSLAPLLPSSNSEAAWSCKTEKVRAQNLVTPTHTWVGGGPGQGLGHTQETYLRHVGKVCLSS